MCRQRLWRSEVEVEPTEASGRGSTPGSTLGDRQRRRAPCKCDPCARSEVL